MFVWHNTVLLCRYGICMKGLFFMLLNAALKEYLLECELRNYTEKTIKGYRNSIELLVNYLQQNGITDVDEVLAPHIKHFLTNLQRAGRKPSYINGLHKAFRAWFKYLQEEEYVSANPMNKISWAKEEKIVSSDHNRIKPTGRAATIRRRSSSAPRRHRLRSAAPDGSYRPRSFCP